MHQSQGGPYQHNNGCTISALSTHYPSAASGPCITLKLVWHHIMYLCGCGCMCARACVRVHIQFGPGRWFTVK